MTNVKIAYLLVAHKNPEQVNMFINQLLQYGACDVYVHVDKKIQICSTKLFLHQMYLNIVNMMFAGEALK